MAKPAYEYVFVVLLSSFTWQTAMRPTCILQVHGTKKGQTRLKKGDWANIGVS